MKAQDYYIQELDKAGLLDSELKEASIRYAMLALRNELLKGILLAAIFWASGYVFHFLVVFVLIMPIRMTTGGLHFNTNRKCFLFSLGFFLSSILLFPAITLPEACYFILLIAAAVLILLLPLFPNEKRPIISRKKYLLNKILSAFFLLVVVVILLAGLRDTPFFVCGVGAFIFQALQLLYLYGKKGVQNVKQNL